LTRRRKTMKRIFGKQLVLTVALATAALFGACEQPAGPSNPELDYIEIRSAADFAKIGGSADYPLNGDYRIPAGNREIKLAGWTPIGAAEQPFAGKFSGNNGAVTIESFAASGSCLGLFGYVRDAEIKDLTVTVNIAGEIALGGEDDNYAGALAGHISGGAVKNVGAAGTLPLNKTGLKSLYAGGIAGYADSVRIEESASGLTIQAAAARNLYAGGLAGYAAGQTVVANSSALGDISASGGPSHAAYAGGLVGYAGGGLKLAYANYTNGTVSASAYSAYSGGIIGYAKSAEISETYASGRVDAGGATPFAGGIAGYLGGGAIKNVYTLAEVRSRSSTRRALAGGIAGGLSDSGEISAGYTVGAISAEIDGSVPCPSHAAPEGALAGGIAGALYSGSPAVKNTAVLEGSGVSALDSAGPSSGQNLKAYRIAAQSAGTLTGNIAYQNIPLAGRTEDDKGSDKQDGEDTALARPGEAFYTGLGWDFAKVWRMGAGGYPALSGQRVNIGDYIEINSGAQLALIGMDNAYPLNGTYRIPGGTADITVTNWMPIGTPEKPFTGSLAGNGTTVIRINSFAPAAFSETAALGLFGYVKGSVRQAAELKDLKVEIPPSGTETLDNQEAHYAGGLAGYGEHLAITGCSVSGIMKWKHKANSLYSGGIAGYLKNGKITNSASAVTVESEGYSEAYSGGILGYAAGSLALSACSVTGDIIAKAEGHNSSAGGIVGYILGTSNSTVSLCAASGNVSLTPATDRLAMFYCGGVVGYAGSGSAGTGDAGQSGAIVEKSRYTGGTVYCKNAYPYAGGVIGYNYTGSTVRECYAEGTVTAEGTNLPYAGGVAGYISAMAKVENSYSRSAVNALSTSKQALAGGIAGAIAKPSLLSKCYAAGAVSARINGSSEAGMGGSLGVPAAANAGGISGSIYFANPKVEKSAALNSSVAGTDTGSGGTLRVYRIGGLSELEGSPVAENNIAWRAMPVTGGAVNDKGPDGQDGEDCDAKPAQSAYAALGWDFAAVWKMGGDGYPQLKWE
jgi:hypothetical protein